MPKSPLKLALRLALTLTLALALAPAAPAQLALDTPTPPPTPTQVIAATATPSCSGGIVYDDGEADDIVRLISGGSGVDGDLIQLFELGEPDRLIEQVCVCWNRIGDPPATFLHELIFYTDDNGAPGQEVAVVPAQINSPPKALSSTFFSYDLTSEDIRSPTENIFIGVRFFGGGEEEDGHVLCYDGDAPGEQPIFASFAAAESWVSWQTLAASDPDADPTVALMIRTDAAEDEVETCPATPCVEDDTTLCLNDDRFRVTATWSTPNQDPPTGPGMAPADELTPDTSYFWFFKETNVEMVVKVLDACSFADRFWVFAGGLTNVEVEMKVCDTQEGIQKTYVNPQETPFQPIQDTDAFATCP